MSATSLGTLGTTRPGTAGPSPVWLRRLLALDAAVTAVNGLAYLTLPGFLGRLLGVDAALLTGLGVFLLLYGAGVGVLASRPAPPAPGVRLVVEGNLLWALAGVAALATGLLSPTTAGLVWIPLQAAVVAAFAAGQHLALRAAARPAG